MAILAPFRGITYSTRKVPDISRVIAPPYDIISAEEQEALYRASPYNVVRLILGRKKKGDSDWDNRYTRSADHFRRWQSEGVLERAGDPGIYVTSLTYASGEGGRTKTRWGLGVLVRIEDEGSGVILPHERTFSAHKDDRLRLMRACSAQFSQVFGLYEDRDNAVFKSIGRLIDLPPTLDFELADGTRHAQWTLTSPALIQEIGAVLSGKRIFIADGHHRYETSRTFRDLMRARYGLRPANRSYEFAMFYLCSMDDEGLTILPSHRLVRAVAGFEPLSFLDTVARWFDISTHPLPASGEATPWEGLERALHEAGRATTAVAFFHHGAANSHVLSLKPEARTLLGEDLDPCLRQLDVLVLSRLIFQKTLGFRREELDNEEIFHYESDFKKAASLVASGTHQMCFLMNPTKIAHVKEIAENGLVMPRKSTYFHPKVPTGLVLNKIDPHEIIQVP